MKPQEGMRFTHSRIRDRNGPMVCEVTRVTNTGVYYEEVATGKRRSTDVMCFPAIVKTLVVPEVAFSG